MSSRIALFIGTDGNIFHLMGIASGTLRKNGMQEQAEEMRNRIFQCQSYDSALSIIGDYVILVFNKTVKNRFIRLLFQQPAA